MSSKNIYITIIIVFLIIASSSLILYKTFNANKIVSLGISKNGFRSLASLHIEAKISPKTAHELAAPYLDKCFRLRKENRPKKYNTSALPFRDSILLKGNWYYVVRENYPAKSVKFYLKYAIKVHKDNGAIELPW